MPRFETKPIEVEAVELRCSYTFGRAKGRAGDWLVVHADGRQEIVGAQAFTAAYVPVANGGAPAPPIPPGKKGVKTPSKSPSRPAKGSRGLEPGLLARIRQQYEAGVPVAQIEGTKGHSANWVYALASAGHWKRPAGPGVKAPAAKVTPGPTGEKLGGSLRCDHCESMTDYDPCSSCGKKLTRTWRR